MPSLTPEQMEIAMNMPAPVPTPGSRIWKSQVKDNKREKEVGKQAVGAAATKIQKPSKTQ